MSHVCLLDKNFYSPVCCDHPRHMGSSWVFDFPESWYPYDGLGFGTRGELSNYCDMIRGKHEGFYTNHDEGLNIDAISSENLQWDFDCTRSFLILLKENHVQNDILKAYLLPGLELQILAPRFNMSYSTIFKA